MTVKIVMIAGEVSGDSLGGQILAVLKPQLPAHEITGIGGVSMQAQGLTPIFPMEDLTVLGLAQALTSYRRLKKRAAQLINHIMTTRPDVIVTIDNKGFSLRLGKALKTEMARAGWSAPIVHVVAPTVWAWGAWRAKSVAASVDKLLCLFPFEVPYFTRYGVDAMAVGHPAVEASRPSKTAARQALGFSDHDQILVLLPGSRPREVLSLLPDMLQAAALLRLEYPDLKIILPAASSVRSLIEDHILPPQHIQIVDPSETSNALAAGDYGLICSGTVTLETALSGLNGHVYYRVDGLTYLMGKAMLDRSKIVLANAISGQALYPLALNKEFNAPSMAAEAMRFFKAGRMDHDIKTPLTNALVKGGDGFAKNAASAIMDAINA